MAHENVRQWADSGRVGPRPCDWCGHPVGTDPELLIHAKCPDCSKRCLSEERVFYYQLLREGETTIKPPEGYRLNIPRRFE